MTEILGNKLYSITRLSLNKYEIVYNNNIIIVEATDNDIEQLVNYLYTIKSSSPLDVIEARQKGICRICKEEVKDKEAVIYNYGKEFAHSRCVSEDKND